MGMISPKTGKYEPIVATFTADGSPAEKASDVVMFKLGDGTMVGGEQYKAYAALRKKILEEHGNAIEKLNNDKNQKLGAALKGVLDKTG